ncbi:hypothetical protein LC608_34060 [Nostoc sp. XA010]|uniref:hypothetical protein n=1 Tax=Nostoc sp. XA010 TaxID=2780407 RepID=UPI001E2F44A7|nr:hypothetical protein [Nostoc sp. XA010]MCC5661880.1 hypothetical protein [Nostoc sp. XA010]
MSIFPHFGKNQFFGWSWQLQRLCRLKILEHNFYDRASGVWLPAYPSAKSAMPAVFLLPSLTTAIKDF